MWGVVYHICFIGRSLAPTYIGFAPVLDHGYLAVDLLFILSGFVLAANYSDASKLLQSLGL